MRYIFIAFVCLLSSNLSAQRYVLDSLEVKLIPLVNHEANVFKMASESSAFDAFFSKLDRIYSFSAH